MPGSDYIFVCYSLESQSKINVDIAEHAHVAQRERHAEIFCVLVLVSSQRSHQQQAEERIQANDCCSRGDRELRTAEIEQLLNVDSSGGNKRDSRLKLF